MNKEAQYTVLVPVSLPSAGPGLVQTASVLARPGRDPRIRALHIEAPLDRAALPRKLQERAELREEALGSAVRAGATLGLEVQTMAFAAADVASSIMEVAEDERADLIVMGWTKPILGRSIPSPTVNALLEGSTTDVAVYFERQAPPWRNVLLPFVGGPHDQFAIELLRRIVESGAKATILHVVDPDRPADASPRLRTPETGSFRDGRVTLKVVESWDPLGETVRESRRGYDLIVIGVAPTWSSGRSPFGKQHERIARESDASLLIVRSKAASPATARVEPFAMATTDATEHAGSAIGQADEEP